MDLIRNCLKTKKKRRFLFSYVFYDCREVDNTTTAWGSTHFLKGIAAMFNPSKFYQSTLNVSIPISFYRVSDSAKSFKIHDKGVLSSIDELVGEPLIFPPTERVDFVVFELYLACGYCKRTGLSLILIWESWKFATLVDVSTLWHWVECSSESLS